MIEYKGYIISHEPKPIPSRAFDWDYLHEAFDGAPDAEDSRCGNGASTEDCKDQIDDMETDNEH
jgi:hypothetical protein